MNTETEDHSLYVPDGVGRFLQHATPRAHSCPLTGLDVVALPPGQIDVSLRAAPAFMNIIPDLNSNRLHHCIVDHRDILEESMARTGGGFDMFAGGLDHDVRCLNGGWNLFIGMDESKLSQLAEEFWDGRVALDRPAHCSQDRVVTHLARLAIDHLRWGSCDRLFVEGLAVAIVARSLECARGQAEEVSLGGTDPRIARARDYIEAHLGDELSIAKIASVAAMSPSWFQVSFRAVTGQPVFAYVRDRRLERARLMLSNRRLSLSQIAYSCGFSSHSHMSRSSTTSPISAL